MSLEQTQLLKHVLVASMAADNFEPVSVDRTASMSTTQNAVLELLSELRGFGVGPVFVKYSRALRERASKIRKELHEFFDAPHESFLATGTSIHNRFPNLYTCFDNAGVSLTEVDKRPPVIFWEYEGSDLIFVAMERLLYDGSTCHTTTKPYISRVLSFSGLLKLLLDTQPNDMENKDAWISSAVKALYTRIKPESYWMLTTKYHYSLVYRSLKTNKRLSSCMAYEDSYYRRRVANATDARLVRYVHPLSAYDGCENLRMGVLSKHHPDSPEFWSDRAPFILRMLVEVRDGKIIRRGRAYGEESAQLMMDTHFGSEVQLSATLRAYIAGTVHDDSVDALRYQRAAAPYFDRHNRYVGVGRDGDRHMLLKADPGGCVTVAHGSGDPALGYSVYCSYCGHEHRGFEQLVLPSGERIVGAACIAGYNRPANQEAAA